MKEINQPTPQLIASQTKYQNVEKKTEHEEKLNARAHFTEQNFFTRLLNKCKKP